MRCTGIRWRGVALVRLLRASQSFGFTGKGIKEWEGLERGSGTSASRPGSPSTGPRLGTALRKEDRNLSSCKVALSFLQPQAEARAKSWAAETIASFLKAQAADERGWRLFFRHSPFNGSAVRFLILAENEVRQCALI